MLWVHKKCSGTTKRLIGDENYVCSRCKGEYWPIHGQTVKWMSTAPCLMWKPLSATQVICCALVGAVTVPSFPDVVWPADTLACPNHHTPFN